MDIDLHLKDRIFLRGLPENINGTPIEHLDIQGDFFHFPCDPDGGGVCFELMELKHFTALRRRNTWWVQPHFGRHLGELWGESYFLLFERKDGLYGLLLALPHENSVSAFTGCPQGIIPKVRTYDDHPTAAYLLAAHDDPYVLLEQSFAAIAERYPDYTTLAEKTTPEFVDEFGWCTWEAFKTQINHDHFREGLRHWRKQNFMPGMILIDDGWQTTTDNTLSSLEANPEKFADGLRETVETALYEFHTRHVGVWHTLQGYWHGVSEGLTMAYKTRVVDTNGLHRHDQNNIKRINLIAADTARAFHFDFYRYLADCSISFVKVDNQAGMADIFQDQQTDYMTDMSARQEAIQAASAYHLNNGLISCMCHLPEIVYQSRTTPVWRNSDDFFPDDEPSHQAHIVTNAFNNLWFSWGSLPDWDMFYTQSETSEFHAMARAVSGGPIYCSDKPGETNIGIVHKLTRPDRKIQRADRPALPARASLFHDCTRAARLLKITNRCGNIGVLGLFHCQWREDPNERIAITDRFKPSDIHDIDGEYFAVYEHRNARLYKLGQEEAATITLPFRHSEIITLSPIRVGFAPLGLLNKYLSPAAITHYHKIDNNTFIVDLEYGGSIGFYSQRKPRKVTINHQRVEFHHEMDSGLLIIEHACDAPITVVIQY